ncbi:hypothetical protein WN55_10107, partial [Dufourea novaeangliae]
SFGQLTEVYSDSTGIDYTVITALITNKGSSSSSYRARITDCPRGLPAAVNKSLVKYESSSPTPSTFFSCSFFFFFFFFFFLLASFPLVMLLNRDGEPVARREIRVRKMDRCYCLRHCKCSCEGNALGTICEPMSLENYHAAGFRGSLPSMAYQFFAWCKPIDIVCLFLIAVLLLLLLMGFVKWLIGLCVPTVSRWGLDTMIEADKMKKYFEKDLRSRPVVLDQFGTPVHPDTCRKTVRICNRKLEFFLNLIFFFIYPFATCHWHCTRKSKRPSSQPSCTELSKVKSTSKGKSPVFHIPRVLCYTINPRIQPSPKSEKDEPSPAVVCVSTYGDSINSKMEAEDTKYVIDELKKSQESLKNH